MFELALLSRNTLGEVIRDAKGYPKKIRCVSNSAYEIWEFHNKNDWTNRSKRSSKRQLGETTPTNKVN